MTAPSRSTDLDRYDSVLRELPRDVDWAPRLDCMASAADTLALKAEVVQDLEGSAKWTVTATLLRTVAAAERGYILCDPCGDAEWLTLTCQGWTSLVWAVKHGTALERAEILHALYLEIAGLLPEPAGTAALVLDDIAAAEMALSTVELAA